MAIAEDGRADTGQATPRQLSLSYFLFIVAALTLVAGGIGFMSGLQILSSAEDAVRNKSAEPAAAHGELPRVESAKLKALAPIMTNLAETPPMWIRLESSLMFDDMPADADALAARISEDIVAFLRTVSLKQIEGPTGFQNLSEDLNERARARSSGRVRELIIQGLIVE